MLGQLLQDPLLINPRKIHFVEGDNDWNTSVFRMADTFHRLGHDTIVRSDDKYHNVRHIGTA